MRDTLERFVVAAVAAGRSPLLPATLAVILATQVSEGAVVKVNPTASGPYPSVTAVATDPRAPGTVYVSSVSTTADWIFTLSKSTDGGRTWASADSGLPHASGQALLSLAVGGGAVYAGFTGAGVWKSVDGGASWSQTGKGNPTDPGNPGIAEVIAVDPSVPTTLYAGNWGLFKSTDGGSNWRNVLNADGQIWSVAVDPKSPGTVFAAGTGVYKSTDAGGTWAPVGNGLGGFAVASIAIDPNATSTLYAGTWQDGLFKSTDGGASWRLIDTKQPNPQMRTVLVDARSVVYVGVYFFGVLASTDGGVTWANANPALDGEWIWSFALAPGETGDVYAATVR